MITKNKSLALGELLDMESLNQNTIKWLLEKADVFLKTVIAKKSALSILQGKVVTNLFFEPSTRTKHSFEIAAKRLGAIVINPDVKSLSTLKGESLIDTIRTFEAMGTSLFVVRHPDNFTPQFISAELVSNTPVINAGDGTNQHPTQALLDLLTIHQHNPNFAALTVAIVGDIAHSRVARSLVIGLKTMGTTQIRLIAPKNLTPEDLTSWGKVEIFHNLEEGLNNADVVMALRIQKERIGKDSIPDQQKYFADFGLTKKSLASARPNAIVLHPGPINRNIEIDSIVADGSQSMILQQVTNGVAMRMAIMEALLT